MKTPEQYLKNNIPVIPVYKNTRKPIGDKWQDKPIDIKRFNPGDNIGIHLTEHIDIDVDNPTCHSFLDEIKLQSGGVYGRKSNPESHILFKGQAEYIKWIMHKDFKPYYDRFRKKGTILEIRSGVGYQSVAPGSILDNEDVEWDNYTEIKIYNGDIRKDIELVVFATMLSILYPDSGGRDDYCFEIAVILAKWGKWSAEKINKFIEKLAEKNCDVVRERNQKGTHAHKQLEKKGRVKGLPELKKLLGVSFEAIQDLFEVVGVKIGAEVVDDPLDVRKTHKDLKMYTLQEYMNLDIPKPIFIVEKLYKENSINFTSGPKGNGKTEWSLAMAHTIAKGGDFLMFKVIDPWPILYIDGEMDPYDLIERSIAYTQTSIARPGYFNIINFAQQVNQIIPDIKDKHGQDLILKKAKEIKASTGKYPIIFFDNLRSLSNYRENESDDWRQIGTWLLQLRGIGIVSMVIDHHGKAEGSGPRGSSSKTDWANISLFISAVKKGRTKGKIRLAVKYDKARGLRPEDAEDFECEYDFDGRWVIVQSQSDSTENDEKIMDGIMKLEKSMNSARFKYEEELDEKLESGKLTKTKHKKLVSGSYKKFHYTQKQLGEYLSCSAGKINQLKQEKYTQHLLKRSNEQHSNHTIGGLPNE
jgi:hypothetical protein